MSTPVILNIPRGPPGPPSDAYSVAPTVLASEVGSVIGAPKDAFLRSVTFRKGCSEINWSIRLSDPPRSANSSGKRRLRIQSIEGIAALSKIQPGDYLKSINGKRIGPSYDAKKAEDLMNECFQNHGILSVAVGNEGGDDILIQATIIKPKADMTYEDLGMVVWFWGCLCIKSIDKNSIFKQTALASEDHLVSINDILCTEMNDPQQFAHIVNALPHEITIVVKRKKQRWTGMFK